MGMTFIYILKHPVSGEVRYVGKTNNPKERYKSAGGYIWRKIS